MNVEILFGAMALPIQQQLALQRLRATDEQLAQWEKMQRAIVDLHIHDVLTGAEVGKARKRLLRQIAANVRPITKEAKDG